MNILKKFMHFLARLMPEGRSGENARAVNAFHHLISIKDSLFSVTSKKHHWPVVGGHYRIGDRKSPIAVCTLTSNQLPESLSRMKGVAIAGRMYTPNLGIEKMILNITSNPNIRYLLICGKESSIFRPGQAIKSLIENGISPDKRINQAIGHYPVLENVRTEIIEAFLDQVALIDCMGETDPALIRDKIIEASRFQKTIYENKDNVSWVEDLTKEPMAESFKVLKVGGRRFPDPEDRKGFIIISVDRKSKLIELKHFYPNHKPGHVIKGNSAQSILHVLIGENLVSELSHAGYIGSELAKAEASLKLDLVYEQDRPLRTKQ